MNKQTGLVIVILACVIYFTLAFCSIGLKPTTNVPITPTEDVADTKIFHTTEFQEKLQEKWEESKKIFMTERAATTPTCAPSPSPTQSPAPTPTPSSTPIITPTTEPTPTPTPKPIKTSMPTSAPTPTPLEWLPYLATSYTAEAGALGNREEILDGKKVIAMWQSDTNYLNYKNICEPYRTFYATHSGKEYGALPYGTKVEMRIWQNGEYEYLGVYTLLDDSPTTQYSLSEVARGLRSSTTCFYFNFRWETKTFFGKSAPGGKKTGYIPNWKLEYNGKIQGWLDVKDAGWGFVIVEIKIVK